MDSFQTWVLLIGIVSFVAIHALGWWFFRSLSRKGREVAERTKADAGSDASSGSGPGAGPG